MGEFIQRALRVFLLDKRVFEAVGTDEKATPDAILIVLIVALVSAVSAAISAAIFSTGFGLLNAGLGLAESAVGDIGFRLPIYNPIGSFFRNLIGSFVTWFLWALITYLVGVFLFKGKTNLGEMLRILGFAQVPRILSGLGFIPGIGWIPGLIGFFWSLAAGFVGIRQGLNISTGKTILTIVLSFIAIVLANRFIIDPLFAAIF